MWSGANSGAWIWKPVLRSKVLFGQLSTVKSRTLLKSYGRSHRYMFLKSFIKSLKSTHENVDCNWKLN